MQCHFMLDDRGKMATVCIIGPYCAVKLSIAPVYGLAHGSTRLLYASLQIDIRVLQTI